MEFCVCRNSSKSGVNAKRRTFANSMDNPPEIMARKEQDMSRSQHHTDYGSELTEPVPLDEMREELPAFAMVFVTGVLVGALVVSLALLWRAM